MTTTTITIKELVKRALCKAPLDPGHVWSHQAPANRSDSWIMPPSRIHCLKCGTFLFQYWIALHIINNETMEIEEFPTWEGDHPVYDPSKEGPQ